LAQGHKSHSENSSPSVAMKEARAMTLLFGAAAAAAVLVSFSEAFAVGGSWSRAPGYQALRAGASSQSYSSASSTATVAAIAAVSVAVGAGLLRKRSVTVSQTAARRELAVAYEDSGISLVDNGKFAQGLVGAEGAWGRYEFDPLGLSKYTELMPYAREAELKHGRIAMLAWVGLVVPDFVRIPGERYSFEAIPNTLNAHDELNGEVGVNVQILFWIAIVEFCCAKKVFEWNSIEVAGDYGIGSQFLPKDEEGQKRMRLAELKNGRLAMVAFGGAITQAVITQHPFPWLY